MRGLDSIEHMVYGGLPHLEPTSHDDIIPGDAPMTESAVVEKDQTEPTVASGFEDQHGGDRRETSRMKPSVVLEGNNRIVSILPMGLPLQDLFRDPMNLMKLHPNAFPCMTGLRPAGMSINTYFKLIAEREPITNMQVSVTCTFPTPHPSPFSTNEEPSPPL